MNDLIISRLDKLRKKMIENGLDAYYIATSDYHCSEYICDYFKDRAYMSNFSGSAGELVVTLNEAFLYTDGRYFIQAAKELDGTTIKLMKKGQKETPSIIKLLKKKKCKVVGFDGKMTKYNEGLEFEENFKIKYDVNLVHQINPSPLSLPSSTAFALETIYSGESSLSKIKRVRKLMKKDKVDFMVIASLDDIAWLLNLRGHDIPNNPVNLAYVLLDQNNLYLFINEQKLTDEVIAFLDPIKPLYFDYDEIDNFTKLISNKVFVADINKTNYKLYKDIEQNNIIIQKDSYITLLKAIKNKTEIKNLRTGHILDGVSMVKFMKYLKEHKEETSEITASDYLLSLRKEHSSFIEPSFNTIAAYKEHAAMMHYSATKESNYVLKNEGLFLVDSGGQYLYGTTDITRTFVMGKISDEEKRHFTLVTKACLRLSMAKFLYGCRGINLDILARGVIWNELIDYQCGTGHGVGYLLNVHEAPNGFRWKIVPERNDSCILEEGMITTDEPGVYLEGKYGIRIENELLTIPLKENEYGKFLGFEIVTYCPIDLDGIDVNLLTTEERIFLNKYHQMVYRKLKPYLNKEEQAFLKQYTRAI